MRLLKVLLFLAIVAGAIVAVGYLTDGVVATARKPAEQGQREVVGVEERYGFTSQVPGQ